MVELSVNIKEQDKKYPIFIESFTLSDLKEKILSFCSGEKFVFVFSEKVFQLYGKDFNFYKSCFFILKDGEKEKNIKNYEKIMEFCLKKGLTRKDSLIAIGGGVCGDLTGFVASTYMRGIDFIQVPTTLLADVDSSVGGKTGIDSSFGKNLIGSFYQPKAVFINTDFINTLDDRQFKTGLGEILKYGFIEKSCCCEEDFNLLNFLQEKKDEIFLRDKKTLSFIIESCVKLKKSVVEKDEKESGLRRVLNFGHTYGHAIEKFTNYRKFTHGEAVVEGILFSFNLSLKKNLIDENYCFLARDILKKYGFSPLGTFPKEKILNIMKKDKKNDGKNFIFVLPVGFSKVDVQP